MKESLKGRLEASKEASNDNLQGKLVWKRARFRSLVANPFQLRKLFGPLLCLLGGL